MEEELNLSNDQKQHGASAKTYDEKERTLKEGLGTTELTDEQLDVVSGGVWSPSSKEEADEMISFIRSLNESIGSGLTSVYLEENGYPIITETGLNNGRGITQLKNIWYKRLGITTEDVYFDARNFRGQI